MNQTLEASPAPTVETSIPIHVSSALTHGAWWPIVPQHTKGGTGEEITRSEWDDFLVDMLNSQNLIVLAGSGTSLGKEVGGPSMLQLYQSAKKLDGFEPSARAVHHTSDDENIETLLSKCQSAAPFLETEVAESVRTFALAAEQLIADECRSFLPKADLTAHEVFLRRLGRRSTIRPRLRLFTTNYDLCFETAANTLHCPLVDGFSYAWPRHFNPRYFAYDFVRRTGNSKDVPEFIEGVVHLLKLHGSVNWTIRDKDILQDDSTSAPCLIYPASTKYELSYSQPYLEMMSHFIAALRESNSALVVVGSGFNDDHLAQPIAAAIRTNPGLRVVVVDFKARSNVESGANDHWIEIHRLIQANDPRLTIVDSSFGDFARSIPDLARLTVDERLAAVVRQVARGRS